ncbi:MAG TPA: PQQ-binding-like beta-propeller repeat protein [Terriglobia bacterium]|nr:PQQ-binding-like beta-propeller repeat protein [Terriglobia bacterium]
MPCPTPLLTIFCIRPLTPGPTPPRGRGVDFIQQKLRSLFSPRPLGGEGPGVRGHQRSAISRDRKLAVWRRCLLAFFGCVLSIPLQAGQFPDGAEIFKRQCALCHRTESGTRAPAPAVLRALPQDNILRALEDGLMRDQGDLLNEAERQAVARYLGKPTANVEKLSGFCSGQDPWVENAAGWNGWSTGTANHRFQPAEVARLEKADVPRLKLRWAFGYTGASAINSQPTLFAGRVFTSTEDGTVYSLDARSGCIYWTFKAPVGARAAVVIDPAYGLAFVGDTTGTLWALEAKTGKVVWSKRVDSHVGAKITAAPLLLEGALYVPVSSDEEGRATNPHYACCTFRGSVVALDAKTGNSIWKTYTIPEEARRVGTNPVGVPILGPSGASVWSTPTADLKRHAIYVGTGNSYSDVADPNSDAVIAFDMATGRRLWSRQLTASDRWNCACLIKDIQNCPPQAGDDYDFGSPPMLISTDAGRDLLVIGQKSGVIHALDPNHRGEIVWQTRIGKGGPLGGIEWGGATDGKLAYFPVSDWHDSHPEEGGGLFALRVATGEKAWYAPPAKPACVKLPGCSQAQFTPPTAIQGVVFVGSQDGHLRAHDTADGKVLWDFDTVRDFDSVDGISAHGGSIGAPGPTIANGMVFLDAGYGGLHGNALLAFSVDGR